MSLGSLNCDKVEMKTLQTSKQPIDRKDSLANVSLL